jgi:hypothetical protein
MDSSGLYGLVRLCRMALSINTGVAHMKAKSILMIAALGFLSSAAYASDDTSAGMDKMKAAVTPGEIVLTGSEVKKIHDGKKAKEYRVCVKTETEAAPMKLSYDGEHKVLMPGDCQTVMGKKIEASPANPLTGKSHIVATFEQPKKKKG